jgi:hypothetical protein
MAIRSITRIGVSSSRLSDGPPNELSGLSRAVDGVAASFGGACVICLALTLIRTNRRALTRHLFPSFDALAPRRPSRAFSTRIDPDAATDTRTVLHCVAVQVNISRKYLKLGCTSCTVNSFTLYTSSNYPISARALLKSFSLS